MSAGVCRVFWFWSAERTGEKERQGEGEGERGDMTQSEGHCDAFTALSYFL